MGFCEPDVPRVSASHVLPLASYSRARTIRLAEYSADAQSFRSVVDLCEHDPKQVAREVFLMRKTLSTSQENTMWTALGAVAGWIALILVVIAII